MAYNKKQMQPLIDKFQINPDTNKLFQSIVELFDGKPNYQIWAVKAVFSKIIDPQGLRVVAEWIERNSDAIVKLEKQNVVSYNTAELIKKLRKEMDGIDRINTINHTISMFNTAQRKILKEAYLKDGMTPLDAMSSSAVSNFYKLCQGFLRLPQGKKMNVINNSSSFTSASQISNHINEALQVRYDWNKEDMLAYMANNAPDCTKVYDKGDIVIINVPSFKSSQLMCGGGRTQWCITKAESHFQSYVLSNSDNGHPNRQFFLFDFSRQDHDQLAHIGFTVSDRIHHAHSTQNNSMVGGNTVIDSKDKKSKGIEQVLSELGVNKKVYLGMLPNPNYDWNAESFEYFLATHNTDYAIAYHSGKIYIVTALNNVAARKLITNSYLKYDTLASIGDKSKIYFVMDFNKEFDDDNALVGLGFSKDIYGTLSCKKAINNYNSDITSKNYVIKELNISYDAFIEREKIPSEVLLHKYIDEGDEESAVKLIANEGKDFDVNFEFNARIPIYTAVDHHMNKLFDAIVSHPKYDPKVEDGINESLLESLIYTYGSEDAEMKEDDYKQLKHMICSIAKSPNFDINAQDYNEDTAVNLACEYPNMLWLVEILVKNRNVNINQVSLFECSALTNCLKNDNRKALAILGQRPDIKIREIDRVVAKEMGIKLEDYIKPNEGIYDDNWLSAIDTAEVSEAASAAY